MSRRVRIGDRQVGDDARPYVIAEIGVNHDGSVERALALTEAAANAGADAVKLQLFETDRLMSHAARLAAYQSDAGETDPVEMLRRLELSIDEMAGVVECAHRRGVHAIVTVFSVELVPVAEKLPWDAYKSASPDIINRPLLEAIAGTGRPLVVSTGASTMEEVERAVGWLRPARDRLALLQCVSCYPVPEGQDGLGGIRALRDRFERLPIGYSDHTDTASTAWMAVACGASVLEKHVTYDKHAAGPDHAASATPHELRDYVNEAALRWMEPRGVDHYTERGVIETPARFVLPVVPRTEKRVLDCEHDVRAVSRQSLTTTRALPAGHRLSRDDLTIKRPGSGIPPSALADTIGRTLARPIEADAPVTPDDLT